VLASLGAEVTLIERSAEIHRLLAEGMARGREADGRVAEAIGRMTLIHGDARDLLPALSPEVVLVDPMHPERRKSSLVKQEMRTLRELVGTDDDKLELMRVALAVAGKRVVLKWPRRAAPMEGIPPCSHSIEGKTTRYDVFMTG
jgi:16S rRNA (guanine1516-N2)-methyltransferase